jgi:predicted phosphodiesterase
VLAEAGDATLVFGGDLAAGPLPVETLDQIIELDALAIHGNADRALLEDPGEGLADKWVADQLEDRHRAFLGNLPETIELEIDGLGRTLFCHGSPRSDEEMILKTTPEEWLHDMLQDVDADVVVCGHTHMQFDRHVGRWRVVNAGSVGLPYGAMGAHWVLLGPDVEHRRTPYDTEAAARRIEASGWPQAGEIADENVRTVPTEDEALEFFERTAELQWAERYSGSK